MELRHLRYFVAVADQASFSRAAVLLRVSQPAISRQIRTLEDEVGQLSLTKAGTALLGHARELLRQSTRALLEVKAISDVGSQVINIGYLVSVQADFLTAALRAFQERSPATRVSPYEMTPAAQLAALRSGQLDLALVGHHHADTLQDLEVTVLKDVPLQAIVSDRHLLASRKRVAVHELAKETFIGYREEAFPGRNDLIAHVCREAGFRPRLHPCAETLSAVLALVGAGEGVCLIPADVAKLPHPGVIFLSLQRPIPKIRFAAVTRPQSAQGALAGLLDCLKTAARGNRLQPQSNQRPVARAR